MQTLENKVIIYDDACPMCQAYTAGFIQAGWLKQRTGFTGAAPEMLASIDLDRARHEIPLLDTKTGEVSYGLNALFLILGERMPIFNPLFRSRWFRPLLYPLYQIITFNRRVIAGSGAPKTGFDCAPDVNLFYRWLYIGLALLTGMRLSFPIWATGAGIFFLFTQLLAFGAILMIPKRLDFVGHWATVFMLTSFVLWVSPGPLFIKTGLALGLAFWMWWKRWDKIS